MRWSDYLPLAAIVLGGIFVAGLLMFGKYDAAASLASAFSF